MNVKAEELKRELDQATETITINEPDDSKRMRLGLMDPPAGSYNQYFTNHFFGDAELRGSGMNLNTIFHCLRDPLFNLEQIRVIAEFMLRFSGMYIGYAGCSDAWTRISRYLDLLHECNNKEDLVDVTRSLIIYVNYLHAWTHLYAPWGAGGAGYNYVSKEEAEYNLKFRKSEVALKGDYPYDRGQLPVK